MEAAAGPAPPPLTDNLLHSGPYLTSQLYQMHNLPHIAAIKRAEAERQERDRALNEGVGGSGTSADKGGGGGSSSSKKKKRPKGVTGGGSDEDDEGGGGSKSSSYKKIKPYKNYPLPEAVQQIKECMIELELALDNNFVKELKKRDLYIDGHIDKLTRKKVNGWIKTKVDEYAKTIKEARASAKKEPPTLVDIFSDVKILYPTELTVNLLNMIKNQAFMYSRFNPNGRSEEDPEMNWSGGNIKYVTEKKQMPIDQALFTFAIMDLSKEKLTGLVNTLWDDEQKNNVFTDVVKGLHQQQQMSMPSTVTTGSSAVNIDKETLQEVFNNFSQRLHEQIVGDINLNFLLPSIDMVIDYINAFGYIVSGVRNGASASSSQQTSPSPSPPPPTAALTTTTTSSSKSLLSNQPAGYIPMWNQFVVLQLGTHKIGYDFIVGTDLKVDSYWSTWAQHSGLEMMMSQEMRYNNMMHQFVMSLTHKPYIITEKRPPSKHDIEGGVEGDADDVNSRRGGGTKRKHDDDFFDDDDDVNKHLQEINDLGYKYKLKYREQAMKMYNQQETLNMRKQAFQQSQQLQQLRLQQRLMDHDIRVRQKKEEDQRRQEEHARRMQDAVEKKKQELIKTQDKLLVQVNRELVQLIEKKNSIEKADHKERYQLLSGAGKAMERTSVKLSSLLSKLETTNDRNTKHTCPKGVGADGSSDNGLISSEAIKSLNDNIPNLTELLANVEEIMKSFGMDIGTGNSVDNQLAASQGTGGGNNNPGLQGDNEQLTHVSTILQNRVENILLRSLMAWKQDVSTSQKRTEEMYKRLESLLSSAHESNLPGVAANFDYEHTLENFAKEYDDDQLLDMDMDGSIYMTEDREAMVKELSTIVKGNNLSSTNSKTMRVDDEVVSTVKILKDRIQKSMNMLRVLNLENKNLEQMYNRAISDRTEYHVKLQATKALLKDVSTINGLVSRGLTVATKDMRSQLTKIQSTLKTLVHNMSTVNKKYISEKKSMLAQVQNIRAAHADQVKKMEDHIDDMRTELTDISGLHSTTNRTAYLNGVSRTTAEKISVMDALVKQYNTLNQSIEDEFKNRRTHLETTYTQQQNSRLAQWQADRKQYEASLRKYHQDMQKHQHQKHQPPPVPPPTFKNDPKPPQLTALEIQQKRNQMRAHKTMVAAIRESNQLYNRQAKLARSSWNQTNGLMVTKYQDEPTMFHLTDIVRMAEIHKPIHKESVSYMEEQLRKKWTEIVNASFLEVTYVTINGVTVTVKSLHQAMISYVLPCLDALYCQQQQHQQVNGERHTLLNNSNYISAAATTAASFTEDGGHGIRVNKTSLDSLKDRLKIYRIPERIQSCLNALFVYQY